MYAIVSYAAINIHHLLGKTETLCCVVGLTFTANCPQLAVTDVKEFGLTLCILQNVHSLLLTRYSQFQLLYIVPIASTLFQAFVPVARVKTNAPLTNTFPFNVHTIIQVAAVQKVDRSYMHNISLSIRDQFISTSPFDNDNAERFFLISIFSPL
jgi:hypothetical protein